MAETHAHVLHVVVLATVEAHAPVCPAVDQVRKRFIQILSKELSCYFTYFHFNYRLNVKWLYHPVNSTHYFL